jgi:hypothetical protein
VTELVTKEELEAVVDELNQRLVRQHSMNKALTLVLTEVLVGASAMSLALKRILPALSSQLSDQGLMEEVMAISDGFISEDVGRHKHLCQLLISALAGEEGIEEKMRETFIKGR